MTIDRVPLAGLRAYLQIASSPEPVNLAGAAGTVARTLPLARGLQWDVPGLHLWIEGPDDLLPLFRRQAQPILSVSVMKEMFPGLFAEPFRHRVHTISGSDDFNGGECEGCRVMEIDGAPTLVSVGTGPCRWRSRIYTLPGPSSFVRAAWELATSRLTPIKSFTYSVTLHGYDASGVVTSFPLAVSAWPGVPRLAAIGDASAIVRYQIEFEADVSRDASIYERHSSLLGEPVGRPLLRGVHLLETVPSRLEFFSLAELLQQADDYELFAQPLQGIVKLSAVLDLSSVLVFSENQDAASGLYEHIEVGVQPGVFARLEARLQGEEWTRPDQ